MAEIGAKPNVPRLQRAALRAVRALSTPLLPDDYLERMYSSLPARHFYSDAEREAMAARWRAGR